MNILLFSQSFTPQIGGVENHLNGVIKEFQKNGDQVSVITINNKNLKSFEIIDAVKIYRINHPKIKTLGLLKIWFEIFKKRNLIKKADVIHIHDVFIYYLPFRFLFPKKKIITVFHGWENLFPIPKKNILYKKIAQKLSDKTISIGRYINKHYQLSNKNNQISYGAVKIPRNAKKIIKKEKKLFLFLGRLEKDTGIETFLETIKLVKKTENIRVVFCGDGPLKQKCQKYGEVKGFINPEKELAKADFCFVGGYLSMLEAFNYQCQVICSYENQLKKDYWLKTPFSEFLIIAKDSKTLSKKIIDRINNKKIDKENTEKALALCKKFTFKKLAQLYL
jgi:glycosyltransferase involved in cell wall biosynthesis